METTAVAEAPRATRLDQYYSLVLPPEKREQIARALPRHIRPDLFERNLLNALMSSPDLMKCHPSEVFREVAQIAALGLMLDPQLGEAYLIAGYSGREGRHKPQRRVGYRGLMKLARQTGEIATIYAHEVCQNDVIDLNLGTDKRFDHRPQIFGPDDRGPVIGFYAVVKYKDGSDDFEPMSLAEVERIRERSDAWRAWKAGKVKKPPIWETDKVEMGKKTVVRRLLKRVPQSVELAEALKLEQDREEAGEVEPLSPPRGRPRTAEVLTRLAQPRPPEPTPAPPQPRPPQPGGDDEDPPPPAEDDDDKGEGEFDDSAASAPADDFPGDRPSQNDERERMLDAARAKALEGSRKLRFWRARLTPEAAALLSDTEWSVVESAAKISDAPPKTGASEA